MEKQEGRAVLQITVQEGRNHLIRRMCEAVGLEVARLKRISIGPRKLGLLPPGPWRGAGGKSIPGRSKHTRGERSKSLEYFVHR